MSAEEHSVIKAREIRENTKEHKTEKTNNQEETFGPKYWKPKSLAATVDLQYLLNFTSYFYSYGVTLQCFFRQYLGIELFASFFRENF